MMENKAFIFDMDGVIVDSERAWGSEERRMLESMFGRDIAEKINETVGVSIQTMYEKAKSLGGNVPYDEYIERYDKAALKILASAEITRGTEELAHWLKQHSYRLGLVSSSPQKWIEQVLARVPYAASFDHVESVFEHPELRPKPAPDGYLDACKNLEAKPENTIVLEDSNPGIAAAGAAGCYVIGFRAHVPEGLPQTGADAYADTMEDVIKLVAKRV